MGRLSSIQRAIAVGQIQAGRDNVSIARDMNVHVTTIRRLKRKFEETGEVCDKPRSGRPRVTTVQQDNFIRTTALRNRFRTAKEINCN